METGLYTALQHTTFKPMYKYLTSLLSYLLPNYIRSTYLTTYLVTYLLLTKDLFTRHKLTRVRPGLKLTRVSFCRVNTANPGSTRVKSNPPPEVDSTRVGPGLVWKSVV